jgi:hypothetical protein
LASNVNPYQRPPNDELIESVRYFDEEIEYFIHYVLGYGQNVRYCVCGLDIIDAIIRVDKRLSYFRIFHLISILSGIGKIKPWDGNEGVNITMQNPYLQDLCYSFRFRNFTIDSIIVLADSITTNTLKETEQ